MMNESQNNNDKKTPGGPNGTPRLGTGLGALVLIVLLVTLFLPGIGKLFSGPSNEISYSAFKTQVQQNNVQSVTVDADKITGLLRNPIGPSSGSTDTSKSFFTYLPSFGDPQLLASLTQNGVVVNTKPANQISILNILFTYLPFLLIVWFLFSMYRRTRAQGDSIFSVGQNKAKLYRKTKESTTFSDVAGVAGVKHELKEIVDFLTSSERFRQIGARIPKGVLLVGPPGTGKTLLARALAGEANVPFYSISGSDFMEMFVGVGASRVRSLFRDAKTHSPSIIFIDELDSIGRHRGAGLGGGHDEREQTLNQLLSELDGFEPNDSTIVIAATNRPDILDPALLRPGRFDRRVTVDRPTLKDREEILKVHARNKPLEPDVNLMVVAQGTPGFSGADLANLLNEAALIAVRKGKATISASSIDEARDKLLLGLERTSLVMNDEERKIVAYHEAGHALVAVQLPTSDPIHKVTIIPRDNSMGVTQQLPERDKYLYSKNYILDRITVMLGGRAAEDRVIGDITSGAENDLREATRLARKMVLDWGMSESLHNLSLGDERQHVFLGEDIARGREYSEETARAVDKEIKTILDRAYEKAISILKEKSAALKRVAEALLEKEELGGKEILELVAAAG
ncbi:MAG TPA: ATP-dependent zinc metalloprotease FtsH [Spirochaetia bacterium]|nr:ATP-dependent zinc metalloprotease FtsH [Spirochaetia bacterium]